jgi:hypothetical protein
MFGKERKARIKKKNKIPYMLSETCQVCQSTTEQFADSKTEQN